MSGRFGKMRSAMVVLLFGFWPASALAGTVSFWGTGFETGFPLGASASGNWTVVTSSVSAHSGLRGADITGSTDPSGDLLLLPVSSLGYQNLQLDFWSKIRIDGLEANDQVLVEWSPDGVNWTTLITYTDQVAGDWQSQTFDLPITADDNPDLSLRFWAKLSSAGDRMNFDDLTLTGQPVPEPATLSLLILGVLGLVRRHLW